LDRDWIADGRGYALLVLIPLGAISSWFFFASNSRLLGEVQFGLSQFRASGLTAAIAAAEYANRFNVMAAACLLVLTGIAAAGYAALAAYASVSRRRDRQVIAATWFIVLALGGAGLVLSDTRIYQYLGTSLFAHTLGIHPQRLLDLLDWKLDIANIVTLFAATTLAVAAASIAIAASRIVSLEQLDRHDRLNRRLDTILLASAAVLAAGVIEIKLWYAWPTPYIDEGDRKAFAEVCNGLIGLQSVAYVGVLAGIYFPAGAVLDRARDRMRLELAHRQKLHPEQQLARATEVLGTKPTGRIEQLMRGAAILSPLLVGPAASFLSLKLS
jgi:hypothetical protein